MPEDLRPPYRIQFDNARDPYTARNALGITSTGGGPPAPVDAQYITAAPDPTLTNERVLTNTATVTWDFTVPGQAKANAAVGGGGNVSNSGTPTVGQYAKWVTATTIQGVAPATVLSDIGAQPAGSYQPLDADLTAIAALTGTNTIYYRSAANTWSAVNVSTGLSFSGGNLTATGGGGDVFKGSNNTFTAQNFFTGGFPIVWGNTATLLGYAFEAHGTGGAGVAAAQWSNNALGPAFALYKSRSASIGTQTVVQSNDTLGEVQYYGSDGAAFVGPAVKLRAIANGAASAGIVPGALQIYTNSAAGSAVLSATIMDTACNFIGSKTAPVTGYVGEYLEYTASPSSAMGAGAYTTCMTQSIPAGDWDIQGFVRVSGTAGAYMYVNIHTGTGATAVIQNVQTGILTGLADCWTATPLVRVLLSAATNYNINCYMQSAGTLVSVVMTARRRH